MATLIVYPNLFDPDDREILSIEENTFIEFLQKTYPNGFDFPVSIYCNGEYLEVDDYDIVLAEDDILEMKHRVEGPAIGYIVAAIIVTAAAIYTAIALLPDPDIPSAAELSGASPTYNIRAQSNRARINEAIPVSYGRNRQYPDIAAAPYNRYENNSQFLYQLFCLGQGEYDFDPLNDVYIEDIPINEYQDVTVEKVEPGDTVTLFDDNIYTAPEVKNVQVLSRNEVSAQGSFRFRTSQRRIDIVTPDGSYCKRWEQVFQVGDSITIDAADPAYNGTFIIEERGNC
jgi:hypothetical protein